MKNMSKTTLGNNIEAINSELKHIEKNHPEIIPSIASLYIHARNLEQTYNLLTNSPQETANFKKTLEDSKNHELGINLGKLYVVIHQKSSVNLETAKILTNLTTTIDALAKEYDSISIDASKREEVINDIANRYTTIHVVDKGLWKNVKEYFLDAVTYSFYRLDINYGN